MPRVALWITRAQAVALIGVAIAVLVLVATSRTSLAVGFVVSEVAGALAGAALLAAGGTSRRARTPILLLELIAVGVAGQLVSVHRPWVGVVVGLPALAAAIALVAAAREDG